MKIKVNEQNFKYLILMFIPFLIFFAVDGIFSVHSLIPAAILLFLIDILYGKVKKNNTMIIVILLFIITTVASLLINALSNNGLTTNQTYIRIIYYITILYMYFSLTRVNYSENQLNKIFIANILCGILVSIYLIFINHIWFYSFLKIKIDKNFVGAILAIQGEFAFIKFLKSEKKKTKLLSIFSYLFIFIGIFYTASRASILVYILDTLITVFFSLKEKINTKKGMIKLIVCVFIIPIICLAIFNYLSIKMVNSNQTIQWYWNRYFVNGFGDESVTGRWTWWDNALELFKERPIFGYGIGNVNVSGNTSAVAHNTYIDFLVDQGIIGFCGFLIILTRSFSGVLKKKKQIYYGIITILLLNIMILSATRSTYMWYYLILIYCIGNQENS